MQIKRKIDGSIIRDVYLKCFFAGRIIYLVKDGGSIGARTFKDLCRTHPDTKKVYDRGVELATVSAGDRNYLDYTWKEASDWQEVNYNNNKEAARSLLRRSPV